MNDETNQNSEASDDAEVMTRGEAQKLIGQRQTLKAEAVTLRDTLTAKDATISDLQAKLSERASGAKPDGKAETNAPPAPQGPLAEFMAEMKAELADVKGMFSQHRAGEARSAVLAEVLKQVPDGQHKTAEALLGTLDLDFTKPGAAVDALTILRTDHAAVLVDHTRGAQPRAPQTMPDGKLNFKAYNSFDEVPVEYRQAAIADPETFKRLSANNDSGSSGACI